MDAPSDLIVDVARAADPERAATVTRRLEALGVAGGASVPNFASAISAVGGMAPSTGRPPAPAAPTVASRQDKARVQFEATLLNSFISEMMPKDASSVYGEGYAGDMWRSLLAEKMANEIAKSGSLGIAKGLFGGSHAAALDKAEGAAHAKGVQTDVTLASANALSLPTGAETADGAYLFSHGKTL
jgi:flagellar protein FlgJ